MLNFVKFTKRFKRNCVQIEHEFCYSVITVYFITNDNIISSEVISVSSQVSKQAPCLFIFTPCNCNAALSSSGCAWPTWPSSWWSSSCPRWCSCACCVPTCTPRRATVSSPSPPTSRWAWRRTTTGWRTTMIFTPLWTPGTTPWGWPDKLSQSST